MRPFLSRVVGGGWPDGITPGFVELGASPITTPFQAPLGSIVSVGSSYYRKVTASAAGWELISPKATVTSIDALMQPAVWYPGGLRNVEDLSLGQGAFAAAQGFVFAVPQAFAMDGTLTKIGGHVAGPGTASLWVAVYSALASDRTKPDARLADKLITQVGAGGKHDEVTCNLAVKQGDVLWFVSALNDQAASNGGFLSYNSNRLYSLLGSGYTAQNNTPMTGTELKMACGYKAGPGGAAQPFNEPAADWSTMTNAFTRLTADFGSMPCVMFQFTPS